MPGAGEPGQPDDRAAVAVLGRARLRGDCAFAPEDVLTLGLEAGGVSAAKNDPAAADPAIIHDHETAETRDAIMVVHDQRAARLQGHAADFVAPDGVDLAGRNRQRGRIHHLLDRDDLRSHFLRGETHGALRAFPQWRFREPEDIGAKTVRFDRRALRVRSDVAALDENLLAQGDPNGITGDGFFARRGIPALRSSRRWTILLAGENTSSSPTRNAPLSIRPAMILRSSNR